MKVRRIGLYALLLAACLILAEAARGQAGPARTATPEAPAAAAAATPSTAGAAALAPPAAAGMTWREAWGYGGRIMWVLTAMSVAGLALAIYFLLALRPGQVAPPALRSLVVARLRTGEVHEARQACEARPCPLSVVTLAGLDYLRGTTRTDPLLLREILEGEGSRQAQAIESQTQLLLDLAVIAPMLGLLGTVLGMLKAFGAVAHDVAAARPVVLAEGVTQAIITTVYGLLVAIPAMLAYTYFRRRAARQVFQLEASATEVLTALLARDEP